LKEKYFSKNLIQGSFLRNFSKLAIPNLISTLLASGIVIFDLWYIGMIGKDALAGVAFIFPIYMLASMLSSGAFGGAISGAVARSIGEQNFFKSTCIFRSALIIALIGSCIMLISYLVFFPPYKDQMFLDMKSYSFAVQYGNILLYGLVVIWIFNVLMAVTRGIGNTKTVAICWLMVLIFQVFLASFNFEIEESIKLTHTVSISFLNLFFEPIEWSAISFLGGFVFGIISAIIFYVFFNHPLRFRNSEILKFDGIFSLIKSGSLAGCQSILTITISLLSLSIVGFFGKDWSAGYGIALRLELLLIPVIFGIGGALIALVGTNYGAGYFKKSVEYAWKGTTVTVLLVSLIGITVFINPNLWTEFFTGNEKIILITENYLTTVAICYPFFALGLGLYFVCQAFNTLLWPVLGTLLRLVTILMLYFLLKYFNVFTYENILLVFAFSIVIYGIFIAFALHLGPWKKISQS
tara:strand:- start:921 stop:2318 length:1398 start_codon:yes stop_codon:yes gene_type:complete